MISYHPKWTEWTSCTGSCFDKDNRPTKTRAQEITVKSGKKYENKEQQFCAELPMCQTNYGKMIHDCLHSKFVLSVTN